MNTEEFETIKLITKTCDQLELSLKDFCDNHQCGDCQFKKTNASCRYLINLLMLLHGYRLGTCEPHYREIIDAYIDKHFPGFNFEQW